MNVNVKVKVVQVFLNVNQSTKNASNTKSNECKSEN
jgi:hypothetical protein